jgi:hypothetical protein
LHGLQKTQKSQCFSAARRTLAEQASRAFCKGAAVNEAPGADFVEKHLPGFSSRQRSEKNR